MRNETEDPLVERIRKTFGENFGRYGVRRITAVLNREFHVNHKRVQRIMNTLGLKGRQCRKRRPYSSYMGEVGKVAQNLLDRDFHADMPCRKYVTDVTEFKLAYGMKAYLAPVMDLYNRKIVGYDISPHPDFDQQIRMMDSAFSSIKDEVKGAIFHSDQGWQYQMGRFGDMLDELGMTQSMSRKGNCHDNSVMENFFGRLKVEMYYGSEREFDTFDKPREAIAAYIEWYNASRIKQYLGWRSPDEMTSARASI